MPLVVSARRSRSVAATGLALLASLPGTRLGAQAAPGGGGPVRIDPFCWRGRPLPRCRAFALFELGLYGGLATTTLREGGRGGDPYYAGRAEQAFPSQLGWSIGAMRNRDSVTAVGGALLLGFGDSGNLVAGTARWRRWTGRRTSVELAGGPGVAQVPLPLTRPGPAGPVFTGNQGNGWRPALVGEARANAADLAALSVRGVLVPRAGGRTHAGVFAGASLGAGLAAAGTVAIGVGVALLIAALAGDLS